jgi:transcriptional regulator with XRE-family HTH domain
LIEARVRSGLTQEELADKMGTSQPTIARLESGHKPSLKTLERVAQVTGSKLMIQLVPEDAHPLNSNPNHALISFFKKL